MRFAGVLLALVLASGCSSRSISDSCPSPASTGTSPTCVLTSQCIGTNTGVKLDCSANDGNCVCSENGVVGKTVSFQDSFCGTDLKSAQEAASSACGWNL